MCAPVNPPCRWCEGGLGRNTCNCLARAGPPGGLPSLAVPSPAPLLSAERDMAWGTCQGHGLAPPHLMFTFASWATVRVFLSSLAHLPPSIASFLSLGLLPLEIATATPHGRMSWIRHFTEETSSAFNPRQPSISQMFCGLDRLSNFRMAAHLEPRSV